MSVVYGAMKCATVEFRDPSKLSPATLIDRGIVGAKVASRAVSTRLQLSWLARRDENRLAHRQSYLHVRCAHRLGQSEVSHGSFPGAS